MPFIPYEALETPAPPIEKPGQNTVTNQTTSPQNKDHNVGEAFVRGVEYFLEQFGSIGKK